MDAALSNLVALGDTQLLRVETRYVRPTRKELLPESRLQLVIGPRGVGKTTLLLQHGKLEREARKYAYLSLDDLYFATHDLLEVLGELNADGVAVALLDEVHLYPNWSRTLKNAYDRYPRLKIIATGSAALKIYEGEADLSRRADLVYMPTLSFREYLYFVTGQLLPIVTWGELEWTHQELAVAVSNVMNTPLAAWRDYLSHGAYPGNITEPKRAHGRLREVADQVLRRDIPAIEDYRPQTTKALRRLLALIAENAPFKPNVSKLAGQVETSRTTLYKLIEHLDNARLVRAIPAAGKGDAVLNKPDKLYLGDPNLMSAFAAVPDMGTLRETFFATTWPEGTRMTTSKTGDFNVEGDTFEVNGRNKGFDQIKDDPRGFLAVDGIEVGHGHRIPLYLFGLLR